MCVCLKVCVCVHANWLKGGVAMGACLEIFKITVAVYLGLHTKTTRFGFRKYNDVSFNKTNILRQIILLFMLRLSFDLLTVALCWHCTFTVYL